MNNATSRFVWRCEIRTGKDSKEGRGFVEILIKHPLWRGTQGRHRNCQFEVKSQCHTFANVRLITIVVGHPSLRPDVASWVSRDGTQFLAVRKRRVSKRL